MKEAFKQICLLIAVIIPLSGLVSCSNDDDEPSFDLTGTWVGERTYYNPASGTKSQYLYITFNTDGTADLEFQGPVSVAFGHFVYKVSGNDITLQGVYASSNGNKADTDYVLYLELRGNALIPTNHFQDFVLTRNGETPDFEDGNDDNKENGNNQSDLTRDNLKQLAKELVTVNAVYSNYFWKITIKSTLHTKLENKKIVFGFGCGDNNGTENIMDESALSSNKYCSYRKSLSGNAEIIEIEVPFWYYYIFGAQEDSEISATCEMYYASYVALSERNPSSLNSEEHALYNELVKALNKYESTTKWNFEPSVWVSANDCSIMIARYKR